MIEIYNKKGIDINKYIQQFVNKYGHPQFKMPLFKWQKSFRDHVIRNEKDFSKHFNYIYNNCSKHGVSKNPETYPWSSVRQNRLNGINPKFKDFIDKWFE